jgi:hypothetical protein
MIVLDASMVVELLTNGALAAPIRSDLSRRDESFIAPHLIDVEAMSALRGLVAQYHVVFPGTRRGAELSPCRWPSGQRLEPKTDGRVHIFRCDS